ncbi:complement factor H-related protein 1-like [Salminus brasiliensis]|uniref:complement factor H-related protein 1-like n=1 Tax=Salminus brasiliensis TaxID=930266 RepID=UPI003B83A1E4
MRIILLALCLWLGQVSTEKSCPSPKISQGFLVPQQEYYSHGTKVLYGCNPGQKPALQTWWGELKCHNGMWSHTPHCVAITDCIAPVVKNAKPVLPRVSYPDNSTVTFKCEKGFKAEGHDSLEATCENGVWSRLSGCTRLRFACHAPVRVLNALITQPYRDTFEPSEQVEYICKKGYELVGDNNSTCKNGQWTPAPTCVLEDPRNPSNTGPVIANVKNCDEYPTIEHGDVYTSGKAALTVRCAAHYKRMGPEQVMCVNGQWSDLPVCKAPCKLDQSRFTYVQREYMEHSETESFFCSGIHRVSVKCDDGRAYYKGCQWNDW